MKRLLLLIFLCCGLSSAFSQNDAVKIAEAKIAIEKKSDYNAALSALREVSIVGKSNPMFIYYAALCFDKMMFYDSAAFYYNQYLKLYPNNAQVIERVAELNYDIRKVNELKQSNKNLTATWLSETAYYVPENRFGKMFLTIVQNGNEITIRGKATGFTYFSGMRNGDTITGKAYVYVTHSHGVKQYQFPNHAFSVESADINITSGILRNSAREKDDMTYFVLVDAICVLRGGAWLEIQHKLIMHDIPNKKIIMGLDDIVYLTLLRQ